MHAVDVCCPRDERHAEDRRLTVVSCGGRIVAFPGSPHEQPHP